LSFQKKADLLIEIATACKPLPLWQADRGSGRRVSREALLDEPMGVLLGNVGLRHNLLNTVLNQLSFDEVHERTRGHSIQLDTTPGPRFSGSIAATPGHLPALVTHLGKPAP
jgi:hypothetical protein